MKKILYLILIVATFSGCTKNEQKLFVDEISGNYNISSITFSKSDLVTDSVTFTNAGEFVFENCKIQKKQESRGFCNGYYIFNNEPRFNFGFSKQFSVDDEILQLQANNSPNKLKDNLWLLGAYNFIEKTNESLIINSVSVVSSNGNFVKVKINLVKK